LNIDDLWYSIDFIIAFFWNEAGTSINRLKSLIIQFAIFNIHLKSNSL